VKSPALVAIALNLMIVAAILFPGLFGLDNGDKLSALQFSDQLEPHPAFML